MENEKLVSVVVPMYNSAKYLVECMDSILNQTYANIQIICVDDGSTDSTKEIVEGYMRNDSRIEYVYQHHQTAGAARNRGLDCVRGEYVVFLDSDDFFSEDLISELYCKAQETNADIVVCGSTQFDNETRLYEELPHSLDMNLIPGGVFSCRDIPDAIFQLTAGWAWDKIYRTEFVREKNIRFQDIKIANDELFVDIAYAEAERIAVVDKKLVVHRANVKTSIEYNRKKYWETGIYMLCEEKKELAARGKLQLVKNSFLNRAARYLVWVSCTLADTDMIVPFCEKIKEYVSFLEIFSAPKETYIDSFYYEELETLLNSAPLQYVIHVLQRTNEENKRCANDVKLYIHDLGDIIREKIWKFPYDKVPDGSKVAVYGFGDMGRDYAMQIKVSSNLKLAAVLDKNWQELKATESKVCSPEDIRNITYDYVVIAIKDYETAQSVCSMLVDYGVPRSKIIWKNNG